MNPNELVNWVKNRQSYQKRHNSTRFALVLFGLLLFMQSFGQQLPEYIFRQPYYEYYATVDSMFKVHMRYTDSANAFRTLALWQNQAKQKGHKELMATLSLVKFKYYTSGRQHNYLEFESQLPLFVNQLEKQSYPYLVAEALYVASLYYFHNAQKFDLAFDSYRELYNKVLKMNGNEFPLKSQALYEYGLAFYFFEDFASARKYFYRALENQGANPIWLKFQVYNTLGLTYRKLNQPDSSNYFFEKAHELAVQHSDSTRIAIALGNLGHNYFLAGNHEQAIPLLWLDVQYSREREWGNAAAALLSLGKIYFAQNNPFKAEALGQEALHLLQKAYLKEEHVYYLHAYELLAKTAAAQNNMARAYGYSDSARITRELLNQKMNAHVLFRAKREIAEQKHATAIKEAEDKRNVQIMLRNGIIAFIFLLMVIGLLFFSRKRLKYRQEKLLIEEELKSSEKVLNEFKTRILEKNKLIDDLQGELAGQSDDALQKIKKHTILTETDWENFIVLFDKVHHGYLIRLKQKLPDLSPAEIRFMSLARLDFSSRQMADTLGVGVDAVRMMRHRLRKKLNLTETGTLEELIEMI